MAPLLPAQDFAWWNEAQNWDGVTPWRDYITLTSAFLGPNALPVPTLRNGLLDSTPWLTLGGEAHFSDGDNTQNLLLGLQLPLYSERVALSVRFVPLERYVMDTLTRDLRASRDRDGRGTAIGDVYVGTLIQLVRDHAHWPDLLLGIHLRTASGNRLTAARHTDTPGYFFDLSAGKRLPLGAGNWYLRPHAAGGFYVWQTYREDYRQNDAVLYGAGLDLGRPGLTLTAALTGYYGYIDAGDRPLVYRLSARGRPGGGRWGYTLRFQAGLHDWPYTSVRAGLVKFFP